VDRQTRRRMCKHVHVRAVRACACKQLGRWSPSVACAGDAGFDRMYVAVYLAGGVRRLRAGAEAELGPGAW
jgi:hypothetical protein